MARTAFPSFTKVSQWVEATCVNDTLNQTPQGKTASTLINAFQVISAADVQRETEKAIGVTGIRWNSCGNSKPAIVWLPKSQVRELSNDYYVNCASRMFLAPTWLINAKAAEGYELT